MVEFRGPHLRTVIERPKPVRVKATTEEYRKYLRHGTTGQRFLPDINQSVEWPNDSFTRRRIKEGSVVLEEDKKEKRAAPVEESQQQTQRQEPEEDTAPSQEAVQRHRERHRQQSE